MMRPPGFEPGTAGSGGQRPTRLDDGRCLEVFLGCIFVFRGFSKYYWELSRGFFIFMGVS